ncbi:2-isopropylmalate synthase [compost metagenome]
MVKYRINDEDDFETIAVLRTDDGVQEITGTGSGRLDSISNALQSYLGFEYSDLVYKEHALEIGSKSQAVSYIGITASDNTVYWGCGIDVDIMTSSIKALFSAVNQMSRNVNKNN